MTTTTTTWWAHIRPVLTPAGWAARRDYAFDTRQVAAGYKRLAERGRGAEYRAANLDTMAVAMSDMARLWPAAYGPRTVCTPAGEPRSMADAHRDEAAMYALLAAAERGTYADPDRATRNGHPNLPTNRFGGIYYPTGHRLERNLSVLTRLQALTNPDADLRTRAEITLLLADTIPPTAVATTALEALDSVAMAYLEAAGWTASEAGGHVSAHSAGKPHRPVTTHRRLAGQDR